LLIEPDAEIMQSHSSLRILASRVTIAVPSKALYLQCCASLKLLALELKGRLLVVTETGVRIR
jgi:hypothetical protein